MLLIVKAKAFECVNKLWIYGRELVQLFLSLSFIDGKEIVSRSYFFHLHVHIFHFTKIKLVER